MSEDTPRRRRGAPRGNLNALKHGFYSRQFKRSDVTDLDASEFSGLQDEITMLRVYIRRIISIGNGVNTFPEALALLRVLCLASGSLTRLVKTQHFLGTSHDEFTADFRKALDEVTEELNLRDTLSGSAPSSESFYTDLLPH